MAASMQIDQVGLPAGTPGEARTDGLDDGSVVTLTSITLGSTYLFEFLWVPGLDSTAIGTLAPTGDPKIWTFTPTAKAWGTYRIKLTVDQGLPSEETTIRTFGVRTPSGLLIPAFNERADEDASLVLNTAVEIEASENNEASPITAHQWTGWWDFYHEVITALDLATRRRFIQDAFNESTDTTPLVVGAWYLKTGLLKATSRVYMGTDTGIHQATARLRRVGDPVPIVATWQVTNTLSDVLVSGGSDINLPADDWYTLEILSGDVAAQAILKGVDFLVENAT